MFQFPSATTSLIDELKKEEASVGEADVEARSHIDTMGQSLDSAPDLSALGDWAPMQPLENIDKNDCDGDGGGDESVEMDEATLDHISLQVFMTHAWGIT